MATNFKNDDELVYSSSIKTDESIDLDEFEDNYSPYENEFHSLNQKVSPFLKIFQHYLIKSNDQMNLKDKDSLILALTLYKNIFYESFNLMFGQNIFSRSLNNKKLISITKRIVKAHQNLQKIAFK